MTTDSNQSPSNLPELPELPEGFRHLGEGPAGDAFRELYAEMVKEFTPEEISQVIGNPDRAKEARALANWKTILEDSGWSVLTSAIPGAESFPLDRLNMTAVIPTLAYYLRAEDRLISADEDIIIFVERPSELSDFEKEQAAARPTRYSGLPDDLILLRPEQKSIDELINEKHTIFTGTGRSAQVEPHDPISSDQLRAFDLLRTDGKAAAALRANREAEDTVTVPADLWYALRSVLDMPRLREALVSIAEQEHYYSDWYAEELDLALEKLAAFDAEREKSAKGGQERPEAEDEVIPAHPGDLKLGEAVKKLLKRTEGLLLVDPSKHSKSDAELRAEGNRVHELVEKAYREKGFSATVADILLGKLGSEENPKAEVEPEKVAPAESTSSFGSKFGGQIKEIFADYLRLVEPTERSKSDEPRTGKDLSADFSVQDLIADYDESKLRSVSQYIQRYGNRFPVLFSDLTQVLDAEGFSNRDRLIMVLGALDGYEASEYYRVGEAYRISQIRQLLKRR